MKRLTPHEYLRARWCPYCRKPLSRVLSVTPRDTTPKWVCLSCHASYSDLKRIAQRAAS